MKVTDRIIKDKRKIVIKLNRLEELNGEELRKLIPSNARNIEMEYNDKTRVLVIDYIHNFEIIKER